ncbi:hypothetical protein B0T10DRAFT_473214 [Thelonectria olida]|uniref:Secreted protein n=1 Tax=Thelonectria olida TaxID=1576542 RepID=A0A9P8WFS5_9HYPO|nr:hypothetical protein B0T10DRAFT_473214 [Thelonectria olida]
MLIWHDTLLLKGLARLISLHSLFLQPLFVAASLQSHVPNNAVHFFQPNAGNVQSMAIRNLMSDFYSMISRQNVSR